MCDLMRNAIIARKVCFSYDLWNKKTPILNCVDMSVPQGSIYGLVGPSGCGKTTLLKVIIGLIKLDAGFISVFGSEPGSSGSGLPGVGVGYMPQQLALQDYLTVAEVFKYFGSIHFKSDSFINDKKRNILKLFNWKDENEIVSNLSGGQKRLLSLAVAVFTEPRLIVLDEPTVGVDPILSSSIWRYLQRLVDHREITIIVTTHYIEEMKCARRVAFMRSGEIMTEETPRNVLQQYKRRSLEKVFFEMSYNQQRRRSSLLTRAEVRRVSHEIAVRDSITLIDSPLQQKRSWIRTNISLTSALIRENFLKTFRNPLTLIGTILLPMLLVYLTSLCIGNIPSRNQFGWVVHDDYGSHAFSVSKLTPDFNFDNIVDKPYLSDLLYNQFNNTLIELVNYENLTNAIKDVKRAKIYGVFYLSANFSKSFYLSDPFINNDTSVGSNVRFGSVHLWMDMSNPILQDLFIDEIQRTMKKFHEKAFEVSGIVKTAAGIPLQISEIINGHNNIEKWRNNHFATIGMFVSMEFCIALMDTAFHFQQANSNGLILRSFASGVRSFQIVTATTLILFLRTLISSTLNFLFVIFVLKIEFQGNLIYAIIDNSILALSGVSSGLLLSILIPNAAYCQLFISCYLIILFVTSGALWPAEAMPYFVKLAASGLPLQLPISAMRRIFNYKDINFITNVLPALLVSIGTSTINFIQSCYFLSKKR